MKTDHLMWGLCCNRDEHRIAPGRCRAIFRDFLCLHNIKNEIIKNREIILLRRRIHQFDHLALNVHKPIGIISTRPITGHICSKAWQFVQQSDAEPTFNCGLRQICFRNKWCKLCTRASNSDCLQTFLPFCRILAKIDCCLFSCKNTKEQCFVQAPRRTIGTIQQTVCRFAHLALCVSHLSIANRILNIVPHEGRFCAEQFISFLPRAQRMIFLRHGT